MTKTTKYSVIVPTMGDPALLDCLLESLGRTASQEYEVCLGYDGGTPAYPQSVKWMEAVPRRIKSVNFALAKSPGMSAAVNAARSVATGEWLVWVCDDMAFLPGWDSDFPHLPMDAVACFTLLEPLAGSFPPPVPAGEHPSQFDRELAESAATARHEITVFTPGHFFGSAVMHSSRWVPWPEWCDPYSVNDVSWAWELSESDPDLVFGTLNSSFLYHFVRGTVRHRPSIRQSASLPSWPVEFVGRYGVSVQEAWDTIRRRSEKSWFRRFSSQAFRGS